MHAFYGSRYAACLQNLEALKPSLALDIHLQVLQTFHSNTVSHPSSITFTMKQLMLAKTSCAEAITLEIQPQVLNQVETNIGVCQFCIAPVSGALS